MEKKTEKETRKQNQNSLQSYKERSSKGFTPRLLAILLAPLVIIAIVGGVIWYLNSSNSVGLSTDDHIDITPTQIQEIQNIGQWEFLSINDEELIDTVSRGFFSDSELVRIYYGTVRLGVDLRQAGPQWLHVEGDSIIATLPPITLLERNFIDEAQESILICKITFTIVQENTLTCLEFLPTTMLLGQKLIWNSLQNVLVMIALILILSRMIGMKPLN